MTYIHISIYIMIDSTLLPPFIISPTSVSFFISLTDTVQYFYAGMSLDFSGPCEKHDLLPKDFDHMGASLDLSQAK